MMIEVSNEVGQHLSQLAEERNMSIEDLLRSMLDRYDVVRSAPTLADLAKVALEADLSTDEPVDTVARSRETLETQYGDFLRHRPRS